MVLGRDFGVIMKDVDGLRCSGFMLFIMWGWLKKWLGLFWIFFDYGEGEFVRLEFDMFFVGVIKMLFWGVIMRVVGVELFIVCGEML